MINRPDLVDDRSPDGLEVFQLTTETAVPSCHIYMEAQIFTPDSKRLVVHRSATPHGGDQHDAEHRYLLCDLENGGALSPLTDEVGVTGPSVSPDGQWLYYFHDETELNGGRLTLKRVKLDGTQREAVIVLDTPAIDATRRISRMYPLSSISSDGRRVAISGFLGDGHREPPPWGMLVFDLDNNEARLVLNGPSWCNIHPQYCRSTDDDASHDILVQENHGNVTDPNGRGSGGVAGPGCDIHVIRDDGSDFRDLPWGRDGNEFCEGHQCWRGRSTVAITSGLQGAEERHPVIEGTPGPHAGHIGIDTPGSERNDLARSFDAPHFHHFATDIEGQRFITDYTPDLPGTAKLCVAEFREPLREPLANWRYLLDTGAIAESPRHCHPFLSPDGTMAFFNSDEPGVLQAYMARGF